jgi:hypothetical protein
MFDIVFAEIGVDLNVDPFDWYRAGSQGDGRCRS